MSSSQYPPFMNGTVYAPLTVNMMAPKLPPCGLELEFIYGSSGKGIKGDILKVNNNGEIIYPAAACAIIFNSKKNSQRIFRYHNDDVKCIAMHPNGEIVATGEGKSADGIIHVWNSSNLSVHASICSSNWFGSYGVSALSFSADGKLLAAVGGEPSNLQIVVFEWGSGAVVSSCACNVRSVYYISYCPNDNSFIVLGDGDIKFYSVSAGDLVEIVADFNNNRESQAFYDVTFNPLNGNSYIAGSNGDILVFSGNRYIGKKQVSNSSLYCISGNRTGFLTSGEDGIVRIWRFESKKGVEFTQDGEIEVGYPVSSCVFGKESQVFTWGMQNNRFVAYDSHNKKEGLIACGHISVSKQPGLWGLAVVPLSNLFFTAGDDGRIILWDKKAHTTVGCLRSDARFRGVSVTPSGSHLAASTSTGEVYIFDINDFKSGVIDRDFSPLATIRVGSQEARILRFNPNGDKLAVGGINGCINIFDVNSGFSLIHSLQGHSGPVTGIDWSEDQKYIQSTGGSGDYQLLYWDVDYGNLVEVPTILRDTKWATQTCPLGWSVRGIWNMKEYKSGEDINAVAVLQSKSLLACVDVHGDVNLLRYPTLNNDAIRHKFIGHSSFASNLAFSGDDEHLFTIGGDDMTVFQWRLVRSAGISEEAEKTRVNRRVSMCEQINSNTNETPKIQTQLGRSSVLYRTSSQTYGSKPVDQASKHQTWRGINGKFSKQFVGGMFRNNSLNTSASRHRVLKSTGFSDYDAL